MINPHRHRRDSSKSLVGFVVGDVQYAVPIACVREICNPLPLVALPHAPVAVTGVADYRGDVVPIVDVRVRFGLPPVPATRRTKWIVIEVRERFLALVVDAVSEVFGTGGTELRAAPPLGGGEDARGIAAVANVGDHLVFVLDPNRFAELTAPLLSHGVIGLGSMTPLIAQKAEP